MKVLSKFKTDLEIIISDGGSNDNTREVCNCEKVIFKTSIKGRGCQLNDGAKFANGEILVFLHADTFLPDNAFELLDDFFNNDKNSICRFLLSFDIDHWLLNFYSPFSKYDSIFTNFGDSAIIVRKSFFNSLGGFENREIFEDDDFFSRTKRIQKITILQAKVISSARRFIQNGIIKQQLINLYLFMGYFAKAKPKFYSKLYNNSLYPKKDAAIIVFLRYPTFGKVKTRIASTTTKEFALNFYKQCVNKLISEVRKISKTNKYIFYSEKSENENVKKWLGKTFLYSPQEGNLLGSRMKNAFQKVFSLNEEKIIIIGTDIPDLDSKIISDAINVLENNDIVIGPSKDGGYYLLGMKKMCNQLFEDIEFSTSTVYFQTISKIEKLGLQYSTLPQLQDIDTEEELIDWLKNGLHNAIKKNIETVYNQINERTKQ